jgi:hypothetical protein
MRGESAQSLISFVQQNATGDQTQSTIEVVKVAAESSYVRESYGVDR